ncbi:MAG: mannose-1-phosphate guanylyltransferase/mannose-6-phosphate isomerase [Gammaproteobacteria bacterium]|nr:mannose-1-phosphate guanylyltransferase/mannose-6-phosphate isomerase [Gammaproteobacteria bacterium]
MKTRELIPVLLCGGSGTRLWPLSRTHYPKQFIPLVGETSLLAQTLERVSGVSSGAAPLVVCNENHRFMTAAVLEQCQQTASAILLEPEGRNTAPAIAVAALEALAIGDDPVLLVLAADHVITDVAAFERSVLLAESAAMRDQLVTFGITPSRPETGYGYIRAGEMVGDGIFEVASFVEKPSLETATDYVESGEYYWNSGMFLFRARRYLDELEAVRPNMLVAARAAHAKAVRDGVFVHLDGEAFGNCPNESVDYAVMEEAKQTAMVTLNAGWSDIGSWSALHEATALDEQGNAVRGDVMLMDTENSYVYADQGLVTTVGIKGLVVVSTPDALLVASRDRVQDVRKLVQRLSDEERTEQAHHTKVYRPWGHYEAIDQGDGYQVKRLVVDAGKRISLQRHQHRSEHWVVVRGSARVTLETTTFDLATNESTYIAAGAIHRLENAGFQPLEVIEVQTGTYLGEDDIERFEDDFNRH